MNEVRHRHLKNLDGALIEAGDGVDFSGGDPPINGIFVAAQAGRDLADGQAGTSTEDVVATDGITPNQPFVADA